MSLLSQFAPFVGGGLKSFQTGYIAVTPSSGSGEDAKFTDVTISAVNTAKAIPGFYGSANNNSVFEAYYSFDGSGAASGIIFPRLTSATNLRLSNNFFIFNRFSGRWQVAEAN